MSKAACANCGGTGRIVLMNSWFPADGYRSERCGICKGSGKSAYRPVADVVARQRELRALAKEASRV